MLISSMRRLADGYRTVRKTSSVLNNNINTSREQMRNVQYTQQGNYKAFSTMQRKLPSVGVGASILSKEGEIREFMALYPALLHDLIDDVFDIPEVLKHFSKLMQYNVQSVPISWALLLVQSYKLLEDADKLTPENLRLCRIMGWCIQMMLSAILIVDDIYDNSEMRWNKPCWYKNPDVGLSAGYDALLIDETIYALLRKHFSGLPCYVPVFELFHDVMMKTVLGQALDLVFTKNGKPELSLFTVERYNVSIKYKTAYAICLLVALPMHMTGKYDSESFRQMETVLLEIGQLFQVQEDYIDCFGDIKITGKPSSDIREGKCSWPIVAALQRATPKQREVLEANYGRREPEAVQAVRNLYEELELQNIYAEYTEETYNMIVTHIQQMSKNLPHDLFLTLLNSFLGRHA